jgi:diketogulonate reductase-like aldo/keto reductase
LQKSLSRNENFVTSKFCCTTSSANHVEQAIHTSLKNLRVDYLDLCLVHWPESHSFRTMDATDSPSRHKSLGDDASKIVRQLKVIWQVMESLRATGLSNLNKAQIEEFLKFAKIVPTVHQV